MMIKKQTMIEMLERMLANSSTMSVTTGETIEGYLDIIRNDDDLQQHIDLEALIPMLIDHALEVDGGNDHE